MRRQPMTAKQRRFYDTLVDFIEKRGMAPTLSELLERSEAKSLNTIVHYLQTLETKGYISRRKHLHRNIELLDANSLGDPFSVVSIPVVASVGCDDLSVYANDSHEDFDEFLDVDRNLIQGKGSVVAVRAIGDSMNDANINSGDYVLIQLTNQAENGDKVAAVVRGMVTIKRLDKKNGLTILRPESRDPKYKPIVVRDDFKIEGKVLAVIPNLDSDLIHFESLTQNR